MTSTKRNPVSELSKQTFQALESYINIWCCGEWAQYIDKHRVEKSHPIYMITKEQWALFRRHKAGERNLNYENGHAFEPKHIGMGKLSAKHIDQMIRGVQKYYQTSGKNGQALPYLDYDDHYSFQTDSHEACRLLTAFLGEANLFTVQSLRGINQHIKMNYGEARWAVVNRAILDFGMAANRYVKSRGIWCDVETKGTIQTSDTDYALLAKLPCYGTWTFEKLDQFKATPEKTLAWLQSATEALIEETDQEAADQQIAVCEMKKLTERNAVSDTSKTVAPSICEWQRQSEKRQSIARRIEMLKARLKSMGVDYPSGRFIAPGAATDGRPEIPPVDSYLSICPAKTSTPKKNNLTSSASVSSFPVQDDELALVPKMMRKYRSLSYSLFAARRRATYRAGRTMKAVDFQQALTVMNSMAIIQNKWNDNQAATGRAHQPIR